MQDAPPNNQRERTVHLLKIGFAVLAFAAAAWMLWRQLHGSSLAQIAAAIAAIPPWAPLVAAGLALVSYAGLAASDWWALTVIGKRITAWRIVLVTFASYAASNALGFSLATGGAMRMRFYGAQGLNKAEVAAVTLLAGLSVTLSGFVTAGLALLVIKDPPQWMLLAAFVMLTPALLWLVKLPANVPFLPHIKIFTPALGSRIAVLVGAIVDWIFSGAALYVLIPSATLDQFAPFIAIFIIGSVVSAATGVPGGIGVFEAIVLALSGRFAMTAESAAALLLYRLIYAVIPFTLVALGLAVHHAKPPKSENSSAS